MMKKTFLLLSVLLLVVLTGCDDEKITPGQEISKVYRMSELKLVLNGVERNHKSVNFQTADLRVAEITVMNVIPGEDQLVFSNVELGKLIGPNGYSFGAESITADRSVKIEGSLIEGLLTVDVDFELLSDVVGVWTLDSSPIEFHVTPSEGNEYINMYGFFGYDKIPVNGEVDPTAEANLEYILNQSIGPMLGMFVKLDIDLQKAGELTASWGGNFGDLIPSGSSNPGMVRYNTKEDEIYIAVALDSILRKFTETPEVKNAPASAEPSGFDIGKDLLPLYDLISKAYKGLPMKMTVSEDKNHLSVYVTKEMMVPYVSSLMNVITPLLSNINIDSEGIIGELGITKEFITGFLTEFGQLIYSCESCELRFNVQRTDEAESPANPELTKEELRKELIKLKNKKK